MAWPIDTNMQISASQRDSQRRAFTLTELVLAVAVLIVVILAVARVFSTAQKVTSLGQATSDVSNEIAAFQQQMRKDIQRISPEGFLVIQCVGVRNDINIGGPLVDPTRPPEAIIRSDQLLFFTSGLQTTQTFAAGAGDRRRQQSMAARVYYGHAFQLPEAQSGLLDEPTGDPPIRLSGSPTSMRPAWPFDSSQWLTPWTFNEDVEMLGAFPDGGGNIGSVDATQPPANKWLFVRQPVLLAHDGDQLGDPTPEYLSFQENSVWSIVPFPADTSCIPDAMPSSVANELEVKGLRDGRVDIAASLPGDIRHLISCNGSRFWFDNTGDDQRTAALEAVFYPRAERTPPTMARIDQSLTTGILGSAVSNFRVEWTWDNNSSPVFITNRLDYVGSQNPGGGGDITFGALGDQPWFGLNVSELEGDSLVESDPTVHSLWWYFRSEVLPRGFQKWLDPGVWTSAPPNNDASWQNFAQQIEGAPGGGTTVFSLPQFNNDVYVYQAVFGYDKKLTPWPSALRITMTVHDPRNRIEQGREVQFVLKLPKRVR